MTGAKPRSVVPTAPNVWSLPRTKTIHVKKPSVRSDSYFRVPCFPMQIIREIEESPEVYTARLWHPNLKAPEECPHCATCKSLRSLGYYERFVSGTGSIVHRIRIRRFRCFQCGKTVSLLPMFAQPYRLVSNETIEMAIARQDRFQSAGCWGGLIRGYWRRFIAWIPELSRFGASLFGSVSFFDNPKASWERMIRWGGSLGGATLLLTREIQLTPFARYRCHAPNPLVRPRQVHTPYFFPP